MAFLLKKNCSRTIINQVGGINNSDLSVIVTDATQLPSTGDFLATIWNKVLFPDPCDDPNIEIIKTTNVVGNVLTIERGQENTIGVAHSNGQALELLITAGIFEEIENAIITALQVPIIGEDLTSQIDGIDNVFTISNTYISNTTSIFYRGQHLRRGFGYTETTPTSITILGDIITGGTLVIDYYK